MCKLLSILFAALLLQSEYGSAQDAQASADAIAKVEAAYHGAVEGLLNDDIKLSAGKALAKVISDRHKFLDISYVEPDDTDDKSGWKAEYDLSYTYVADDGFSTADGHARLSTLEAKLNITGSYAFSDAANNEDLSSAKATFSYVYGDFGAVPQFSREGSLGYQNCLTDLNLTKPKLSDYGDDTDKFSAAAIAYGIAVATCRAPHGVQDLFDGLKTQFGYSYELGLLAGIEGNQDYSESHDVFGGTAIIAATRWPSLRLNLERVDASGNQQRTMLTDEDEYDRITVEVGYQYVIDAVKNLPITLSFGYRNFYELSAPREIKDADLDEFDYWSVSLRVPARMFSFIESNDYALFVRYTDGQLPFDLRSDSAFELGFSSNIALLGKLFQ